MSQLVRASKEPYTNAITILQEQNSRLLRKLQEMTRLYDLVIEQKSEQQLEDCAQNRKMFEDKIRDQLERKYQMKKDALQNQLQMCRGHLEEITNNYHNTAQNYEKARQRSEEVERQNQELKQKLESISYQIDNIDQIYKEREQEIQDNMRIKMEELTSHFKEEIAKKDKDIELLHKNIKEIGRINNKTQDQYDKIKDILDSQMKKRKTKEQEHRIELRKIQRELNLAKQSQTTTKKHYAEKLKENMEKDCKISELEKMIKELKRSLSRVEAQSKKAVNRERCKTKKAVEGLSMMKKYSEHELNKSKKKERAFQNSQKELILKIRQMTSKQPDDGISTKSSRKNSTITLNSTLLDKSSCQKKQSHSPCVSHFVADDQSDKLVSPAQSQRKAAQPFNRQSHISQFLGNSRNQSRTMYLRDVNSTKFHQYGVGTPCFESGKIHQGMFRADK